MDNLIEINSSIHDDICTGSECCYYRVCRQSCGYCPKKIIRKAIKKRDEREQYIINLHCGFYDGKQYSFAEIGRRLGVTGTRVSQIYKEAVRSPKYKAYYGIPEVIIAYGDNYPTAYSKFYCDVFYNFTSKLYEIRECNVRRICGNHIPYEILLGVLESKPEAADKNSKWQLFISTWNISDKLRTRLQNSNIDNIVDIFSYPFHVLFFDILKFDYNLLLELRMAIQWVIQFNNKTESAARIFSVADINDDDKKQIVKEYIVQYIVDHGQFLSDYSNCSEYERLKIRVERIRTASLIAELWYTDSLYLLDEYGFDFQAYWQRVNQYGFDVKDKNKLSEIVKYNFFPESVKNISEQSTIEFMKKLDIEYCNLPSHSWSVLKRAGIRTVGQLIEEFPGNNLLLRGGKILYNYVQSLENFIKEVNQITSDPLNTNDDI